MFNADDPELTVPILDALSNLCLAPEDTDSVRTIVLSGLDSHEPESMPVVVKFILQSITSDNATKVSAPPALHCIISSPTGTNPTTLEFGF